MKRMNIEVYVGGRYAGTIGVRTDVPVDEESLAAELERRLPTLRPGKYEICFA